MVHTQTFPPQAYSKETISEAFTWLQSQPDEIKKKATHTEALLSLYLKNKSQQYWIAKTNTSISNDTNNFNNELQEIALELSPDQTQATSQSYSNRHGLENTTPQNTSTVEPIFNKPSNTLNGSSHTAFSHPLRKKEEDHTLDTKQDIEDILDVKSLNSLHRTKTKFNLSSNKEAARLLISLGFEQIKSLISDSSIQPDLEDPQI